MVAPALRKSTVSRSDFGARGKSRMRRANGRLISESSFSNGFMAILVGRLQGMVSTAVILDQSQRSFG